MIYRSPYPYYGGKSRIASQIWDRLGNPPNYVEPIFMCASPLVWVLTFEVVKEKGAQS